ncbi:MAG: hypothetical protein AAF581_09260 [Planctomycetota bacterium]
MARAADLAIAGVEFGKKDQLQASARQVAVFLLLIVAVATAGFGENHHFRPRLVGVELPGHRTTATAQAAADRWMRLLAPRLGGGQFELQWRHEFAGGKLTIFAYSQRFGDLPVDGGNARLVVHNSCYDTAGQRGSRVVYAASTAASSVTPQRGPLIAAATALSLVRSQYPHLDRWSSPELAILPRMQVGVRTWRIHGQGRSRVGPLGLTFFVAAERGELLLVRDGICSADIVGTVTGRATPGLLPDTPTNPPTLRPLASLEVEVVGGAQTVTAADGTFLLPAATAPVTVAADLVGPWVKVVENAGANLHDEEIATPPATVNLSFNNGQPSQFTTSQVNAFLHVTATYDFFKSRQPHFTGIDQPILATVNRTQPCSAFFDPFDIELEFSWGAGGCANSAYSSVITHEYGHFIVHVLGVGQGAFGEGFADALSILRFEDPRIGADFQGPGTFVRRIGDTQFQYPCTGSIHTCGEVLAGVFWDLKNDLQQLYGAVEGLEKARQIFVDFSAVTLGGLGQDSAHPQTVFELLIADDDDGDLGNGTPHFESICWAVAQHGLTCPSREGVAIRTAHAPPLRFDAGITNAVRLHIAPLESAPIPNSGLLHHGLVGGPFLTVPLVALGGDQFEATFPSYACGDTVAWYVTMDAIDGTTSTFPAAAPAGALHTRVAVSGSLFVDTFEHDLGWAIDPASTASDGAWERVDPTMTDTQPALDTSTDGIRCYITDNQIGLLQADVGDVDGGTTILVSPSFDLSAAGDYYVSYWRWYYSHFPALVGDDTLRVEVSTADGATGSWVALETVGPLGPETTGGWFEATFHLNAIVSPSAATRFRFIAEDQGAPHPVEAAIDDFRIEYVTCSPAPFARGDCDGSGHYSLLDAIRLLTGLFGGALPLACQDACDADDDGAINLLDVVTLLGALFDNGALPAPYLLCGVDGVTDALTCLTAPSCP